VVFPPLPPELGGELELDSFFGAFFFGGDFRAGRADEPATLEVMVTDASSTAFVPSALVFAVPLEPLEPPVPLPMPNATAKATRTTASVIPI
jgi:hypothetical protein